MAQAQAILYLHGFNSSPQSAKAAQMRSFLADKHPQIEFVCPQLACFPMAAWQQIEALLAQYQGRLIGVMGSSLGGFLATKVAELTGLPAVLINPAVKPYDLLVDYLGPQTNPYTQQDYLLESSHIQELRELEVQRLSCQKQLWVLLQTGDEVLDFRLALAEYVGAKITTEQGGDHSFQGFERHLPALLQFMEKD